MVHHYEERENPWISDDNNKAWNLSKTEAGTQLMGIDSNTGQVKLVETSALTQVNTVTHRSESLKKLGEGSTNYVLSTKDDILEAFEAPPCKGVQIVNLDCPEFTANCPKTGQPDFGRFYIDYVPSKTMVESKSLKLYLFAFRNEGHFHEEVVAKIHDDLSKLMNPVWLRVEGYFMPRGGISINPTAESGKRPSEYIPCERTWR